MARGTRSAAQDTLDWLAIVRSEYLQMPGLSPTLSQAQRLWNVDPGTLRTVFSELEQRHFLRRTSSGAYVRADER